MSCERNQIGVNYLAPPLSKRSDGSKDWSDDMPGDCKDDDGHARKNGRMVTQSGCKECRQREWRCWTRDGYSSPNLSTASASLNSHSCFASRLFINRSLEVLHELWKRTKWDSDAESELRLYTLTSARVPNRFLSDKGFLVCRKSFDV